MRKPSNPDRVEPSRAWLDTMKGQAKGAFIRDAIHPRLHVSLVHAETTTTDHFWTSITALSPLDSIKDSQIVLA